MKKKTYLNILQYNVKNDKTINIIFLFCNSRTRQFNILTIQKLWKNPKMMTSLNSIKSNFHLLYKLKIDIKICFYVNKNIDSQKWKMKFLLINICTLCVNLWSKNKIKMVHIHNIYNSSFRSYMSMNSSFMLLLIKKQLKMNVKHIFLKNFNLHHFMWCGSTRLTQHVAATQLIKLRKTQN